MSKQRTKETSVATTQKVKVSVLAIGILLCSFSAHFTGFSILKNMAVSHEVVIGSAVIAVLLAIAGTVCIGAAVFYVAPAVTLRDVMKPLLFLAVGYLVVQVISSVIMGAAAMWCDGVIGMDGEAVKSTVDIVSTIIQVPIKAGGAVMLLGILSGQDQNFWLSFMKCILAFAVLAAVQLVLGMMGSETLIVGVRILITSLLTAGMWVYLFTDYCKGGHSHA